MSDQMSLEMIPARSPPTSSMAASATSATGATRPSVSACVCCPVERAIVADAVGAVPAGDESVPSSAGHGWFAAGAAGAGVAGCVNCSRDAADPAKGTSEGGGHCILAMLAV